MKIDYDLPEGSAVPERNGIVRLEMVAETEKQRFLLLSLLEFYEALTGGEAGFASRPLSFYSDEVGS